MTLVRKCQDPTHRWDDKARRCRDCRNRRVRESGNREGNRGGTECTYTMADWAKATGYDPVTRTYSQEPQDVRPVFVSGFDRKQTD
jgi:hypothetical protein